MADTGAETLALLRQLEAVINAGDVDAMMACMTDDTVFENTSPAPDGERFVGAEAVRGFFAGMRAGAGSVTFETEELFAAGDRGVVRWVYRWVGHDGQPGHVRGVDVVRVRDGKISEAYSYVKG